MPIMPEYANRSLYHITHIDNLPDIIEHGLLSTNERQHRGIGHTNIAYRDIQDRRSAIIVPCGYGGVVHDYVPLYFCKRCPMLYAVIHNQGVSEQQIIYLEFPIQILEQYHSVFTDASANASIPQNFYSDTSNLVNLNWNAIDTWSWGQQYDNEVDISQEKQAEALIYRTLPLDSLRKIVVRDSHCKVMVEALLTQYSDNGSRVVIGGRNYYFTEGNPEI